MVAAAPDCFFVPPYVGPSGWIGIWLDGVVDWDDVADFLRDSYRLVAPKKLCGLLDADGSPPNDEPQAQRKAPAKKTRLDNQTAQTGRDGTRVQARFSTRNLRS